MTGWRKLPDPDNWWRGCGTVGRFEGRTEVNAGPGRPGLFCERNKKPPTSGGGSAFAASWISLPIPHFGELKDWPCVSEKLGQGEPCLCA